MTSVVFRLFSLLACGHAFADFALQSDLIAKGKNRHTPAFNVPTGQTLQTIWPWVLSAHAAIHAGTVMLITGSLVVGLSEFVLHWIIDFAKCENWTGIHTDQTLHLICKLAFAIYLVNGWL
jgi:predicted DNA repair protein MutK